MGETRDTHLLIKEYVGSAGYFFDTPEEAAEIIKEPFPNDKREQGFSLAKRSDVRTHLTQLEKIWGWR